MYHPSKPWGSQVRRPSGLTYAMIMVIGGANGVLLQSKAPLSWASANMRGFMADGRRSLRVVVALGRRRHHKCIGKEGSTLANPAIK